MQWVVEIDKDCLARCGQVINASSCTVIAIVSLKISCCLDVRSRGVSFFD
jgi:hypothetical protein